MNTVRLYKNPNPYPYYGGITSYKTIQATPKNQNLKSGFIDMQLTFDEVLQFNYLSFTRSGRTIYAWVSDVETLAGDRLFRVHYNIDSFRTYKNDLVLGTQYVERSPTPTKLYDPLLGSTKETSEISRTMYNFPNFNKRYAVVQKRPDDDEVLTPTPLQPSPYKFYICEYEVDNWQNSIPLRNLISALSGAETTNIVTVYSIPYVDVSSLPTTQLTVRYNETESKTIEGWKLFTNKKGILTRFIELSIPPNLTKVKHNVMIVIPEAGILNIPPELYERQGLGIRQDVDLYSGACNYMVASSDGNVTYHLSLRGSSVSSIPISSDPYDTYMSQNQNTLVASILGDTANIVIGGGMLASGNPMGTASIGQGITSMITRSANWEDMKGRGFSNPPAFLGSAISPSFPSRFWQIITKTHVDNQTYVNNRFGYPCERVQQLVIPSKGFIKTQNCNISSNGNVPLWAINEINSIFDNGIMFR